MAQVLIVEDDFGQRKAFRLLLKSKGYKTIEAETLAEGLAALSGEIDLIILDLALPDGSGADILEKVRESGRDIKVAIVSGAGNREVYDRVTRLKPDAIFGKPLDVADFCDWLPSIKKLAKAG